MDHSTAAELADPLEHFRAWMKEAEAGEPNDPNAMAVATVDAAGQPSVRMVLLKGADERGFAFYTNRESRKGLELGANPRAALVVYWQALGRQVRVEGRVEEVDAEETADYWATRPRGSRLSAAISPQSRVVESRAWLEQRVAELDAASPDGPSLPAHWGGYRVVPETIELWEHRDDRLHDRVLYTRDGDDWRLQRLAP